MRDLLRLLPLGLIAVLVQLWLPLSLLAITPTIGDPLGHLAFCGTAEADRPTPDNPQPHAGHTACPFCHHPVSHPMLLPPAVAASPRPCRAVIPVALPYVASRPRAPPRLLPPARAPPLTPLVIA